MGITGAIGSEAVFTELREVGSSMARARTRVRQQVRAGSGRPRR